MQDAPSDLFNLCRDTLFSAIRTIPDRPLRCERRSLLFCRFCTSALNDAYAATMARNLDKIIKTLWISSQKVLLIIMGVSIPKDSHVWQQHKHHHQIILPFTERSGAHHGTNRPENFAICPNFDLVLLRKGVSFVVFMVYQRNDQCVTRAD